MRHGMGGRWKGWGVRRDEAWMGGKWKGWGVGGDEAWEGREVEGMRSERG